MSTSDTLNPVTPASAAKKMDGLLAKLLDREVSYETDIEEMEDRMALIQGKLSETRALIAEVRSELGL